MPSRIWVALKDFILFFFTRWVAVPAGSQVSWAGISFSLRFAASSGTVQQVCDVHSVIVRSACQPTASWHSLMSLFIQRRKKLLIIWQDKLLNDLGHGLHCLWLWTYFLKALSLITATFSPRELPQPLPSIRPYFLLVIQQTIVFINLVYLFILNSPPLLPFFLNANVSEANPFPALCSQQGLL